MIKKTCEQNGIHLNTEVSKLNSKCLQQLSNLTKMFEANIVIENKAKLIRKKKKDFIFIYAVSVFLLIS